MTEHERITKDLDRLIADEQRDPDPRGAPDCYILTLKTRGKPVAVFKTLVALRKALPRIVEKAGYVDLFMWWFDG